MTRAAGLAGALRAAGLAVTEYPGWQARGFEPFRPQGVVLHHTGPWSTVDGMVQLCTHGRPDLAGPLCQVVLDPCGACHVIAAGSANHAGAGGWAGLTGNASVFGIEAIHSGDPATPWPDAQVAAMAVAAAALCRLVGTGAAHVCGHKEWAPRRKVDPIMLDMAQMRRTVDMILHLPPAAGPVPPPPAPARPAPVYDFEEASMKTTLVNVRLDDAGNGWADFDPALGRDPFIVGAVLLGPSPPDEDPTDPYWAKKSKVVVAAQPRAGKMRVTARGGAPGDTVGVWVTVS